MSKPTRTKTPVGATISRDAMELAVADMRQIDINTQRTMAKKNKEIAAIDAMYAGTLSAFADAKKEKYALVQAWAEAHPEAFEKRKSIELAAGTVGFRDGTPKMVLLNRQWTWETALAAVMEWLPNFVRNAPEIDKAALIAQRDEAIIQDTLPRCGLKITNAETFFVKTNVEETDTVMKEAV